MSKTFSTKTVFVKKNRGFLDCFLGTKATTVMCGWSKLRLKQIKLIWMFAFFQKNITYKNHVCPNSLAFFYCSLLVREFKSHGQT